MKLSCRVKDDHTNRRAFTLIEMLVTISVIATLLGILLPSLIAAKQKSKQLVCQSNIRQLVMAVTCYADDNNGSYVLAAPGIFGENKHRWHGVRENDNEPFDRTKGPLARYLKGQNLKCTAKVKFVKLPPSDVEYDEGGGGYGYNMIYIGSVVWSNGYEDENCKTAAKDTDIRQSSQTLMFADTAMARFDYLTEYSFAEPRYFVVNGTPVTDGGWDPVPSIHFRHRGRANIGWVDGSAASKKMGNYEGTNLSDIKMKDMDLGWFEPMNNTMFDVK